MTLNSHMRSHLRKPYPGVKGATRENGVVSAEKLALAWNRFRTVIHTHLFTTAPNCEKTEINLPGRFPKYTNTDP
jgi:hypothetical protein